VEQLEQKLTELSGAIQAHVAKYNEEAKSLGAATNETRDLLAKLREDQKALQKQLDALDERVQAKSLEETDGVPLVEYLQKETDCGRLVKDNGHGRVQFTLKGHHAAMLTGVGRKTTLTSDNVGATPRQTTGVLAIERDPGITAEARRLLRIRDLLASRPTSAQVIDFVKVANAMSDAAMQSPEGAAKLENAITFSSSSERVKTCATWLPVTRQILADWSELEAFLRETLRYYVMKEAEDQILNGNGVDQTINGLIPQATAFNTDLLPAAAQGWSLIDIIGWAAAQVQIANEIDPSFVVLHPQDLWEVRMAKDSDGRYILGDPWSQGVPNIFGLDPVGTTAMTQGTFLVGSGNPAATELRSRMEIEIAIGEQHSDFFTKNLVAIRAEERFCLVTKRPASFITGSTTTSPA
jgi:HK97 family phage major capsid protein